jgi:hypothetical protein
MRLFRTDSGGGHRLLILPRLLERLVDAGRTLPWREVMPSDDRPLLLQHGNYRTVTRTTLGGAKAPVTLLHGNTARSYGPELNPCSVSAKPASRN